MTLILSESFEGGTNGTALSGVNTNYTAGVTVSSATATFDNSIIGAKRKLLYCRGSRFWWF
jgi:hypothetical protein